MVLYVKFSNFCRSQIASVFLEGLISFAGSKMIVPGNGTVRWLFVHVGKTFEKNCVTQLALHSSFETMNASRWRPDFDEREVTHDERLFSGGWKVERVRESKNFRRFLVFIYTLSPAIYCAQYKKYPRLSSRLSQRA